MTELLALSSGPRVKRKRGLLHACNKNEAWFPFLRRGRRRRRGCRRRLFGVPQNESRDDGEGEGRKGADNDETDPGPRRALHRPNHFVALEAVEALRAAIAVGAVIAVGARGGMRLVGLGV